MDHELVEEITQARYWEKTGPNKLEQFAGIDREIIDEGFGDDIVINFMQTGVARIGTPPDIISIKKNTDNYFFVYVQSTGRYYQCDTHEGLKALLSSGELQ